MSTSFYYGKNHLFGPSDSGVINIVAGQDETLIIDGASGVSNMSYGTESSISINTTASDVEMSSIHPVNFKSLTGTTMRSIDLLDTNTSFLTCTTGTITSASVDIVKDSTINSNTTLTGNVTCTSLQSVNSTITTLTCTTALLSGTCSMQSCTFSGTASLLSMTCAGGVGISGSYDLQQDTLFLVGTPKTISCLGLVDNELGSGYVSSDSKGSGLTFGSNRITVGVTGFYIISFTFNVNTASTIFYGIKQIGVGGIASSITVVTGQANGTFYLSLTSGMVIAPYCFPAAGFDATFTSKNTFFIQKMF